MSRIERSFDRRWKQIKIDLPPPERTEWDFDPKARDYYLEGWRKAVWSTREISFPPLALSMMRDRYDYARSQGWDDAWSLIRDTYSDPLWEQIADEEWTRDGLNLAEMRSRYGYTNIPLTAIPDWKTRFEVEWVRLDWEEIDDPKGVPFVYTGESRIAYLRGKTDAWRIGLANFGYVPPYTNRVDSFAVKAYIDGYKYYMHLNTLVNESIQEQYYEETMNKSETQQDLE